MIIKAEFLSPLFQLCVWLKYEFEKRICEWCSQALVNNMQH